MSRSGTDRPSLPAGMAPLLGDIAADAGRHRARTLLGILAAGPDYVEGRLSELDAALGTDSPGPAELRALIEATRAATSSSAEVVPKQHVISQVLFKQWTERGVGRGGMARQLIMLNIERGTARPRTTGQLGYVTHFVKIDSNTVEQVWHRVENQIPAALAAAHDGSIFSRPDLEEVLRQTIALHFARNPQTAQVHVEQWLAVVAKEVQRLAGTPVAEEAFRRRYGGILPARPQGRRLGAEALLAHITEAEASGALFRLIVEDRFDRTCGLLKARPLEIVTPEQPDDEFIVGDTPAVPFDVKRDAVGVREGVALLEGDTVMLPLGPKLLVALGPSARQGMASPPAVERINRIQFRAAQGYVCYRPGARVAEQLAEWLDEGRAQAPARERVSELSDDGRKW